MGRGHAGGMNTAASVINRIFILMVIRQIREQSLDARSLATLVLAVGCAGVMFLHAAAAGGNDIALEAACLATGEFACQVLRWIRWLSSRTGRAGPSAGWAAPWTRSAVKTLPPLENWHAACRA